MIAGWLGQWHQCSRRCSWQYGSTPLPAYLPCAAGPPSACLPACPPASLPAPQIRTTGRDYQQRGLVATLATARPNKTAHQRFLPTGPLALLPLRGGYSSLVWSCPPEMAARLEALPRQELAAAVNEALTGGPHYPPRPLLGSLLGGLLGGSPGSSAFAAAPPVVDVVGETPKSFPLALQHAGKHARWCGVAGWGCSMCMAVEAAWP